MRWLLATVVAALLFTAGAGAIVAPRLHGIVMRGPVRPVCEEGVPCDKPAPGVVLIFSRGGVEIVRTTTRANGTYSARIAPGLYTIRTLKPAGPGKTIVPRIVRVSRDASQSVNFFMDTGIRASARSGSTLAVDR